MSNLKTNASESRKQKKIPKILDEVPKHLINYGIPENIFFNCDATIQPLVVSEPTPSSLHTVNSDSPPANSVQPLVVSESAPSSLQTELNSDSPPSNFVDPQSPASENIFPFTNNSFQSCASKYDSSCQLPPPSSTGSMEHVLELYRQWLYGLYQQWVDLNSPFITSHLQSYISHALSTFHGNSDNDSYAEIAGSYIFSLTNSLCQPYAGEYYDSSSHSLSPSSSSMEHFLESYRQWLYQQWLDLYAPYITLQSYLSESATGTQPAAHASSTFSGNLDNDSFQVAGIAGSSPSMMTSVNDSDGTGTTLFFPDYDPNNLQYYDGSR